MFVVDIQSTGSWQVGIDQSDFQIKLNVVDLFFVFNN